MRRIEFTFQTQTNCCGNATHGKTGSGHAIARLRKFFYVAVLLLLAGWGNGAFSQCALVCNDQVNVSLPGPDANCELLVTVDMVLEPYSCISSLSVTIMTMQGIPLPTSPVVNASHIGQMFIYSVSEDSTGNSCWGTLKVEDKLSPQISNCGDVFLPCLADYRPTMDGGDAPTPTFEDCSQIVTITYSDILDHGTCSDPYVALALRTWTAIDKYGNTSTCSQYINVQRVSLADYTPVCPANVNLQCGSGTQNTAPSATGYPTITVLGIAYPVVPGANNFCEIAASYTDEVFNICGGGKKILRTWNIYDWCLPTDPSMGNPFTCIQVIKIEDTTPPVITCPPPIVSGSASSSCSASLTLPPATVTDACSNWTVKVLTPFGVVNGNGGLLLNVPVGVHQLTYVATDACGNIASCITTLTVQDDTQPVAVCDEHTTVSLTADGTALVSALVFDDGSTDNCAIESFKVRRMASNCQGATNFADFVTFTCCDIGDSLMVVMRVFDQSGNYNDCMVEVTVQDKIFPTIVCPPNATIECSAPVPPVQTPTYNDNCPGSTWTHTETSNISSCGVGSITRTYTVTDASGKTATCTQTITVINSDPFTGFDIVWPLDYSTEVCDAELEPEDLPPGYDYPDISEDECDLVAVAHTDQVLPTNPPACFKILRKWIVIDWCIYNPNNPSAGGYWEHVQVLQVKDTEPPVLTCPGNVTVSSTDANCGTGSVTVDPATATDCSPIVKWTITVDYNNNGSIDVVSTNPNLSGTYPFGLHKVTVKAEDFCGNSTSCTFTIEVKDGKKPTPVCVNGLSVELMPDPAGNGGMVTLTPQMFNQGSFDNCTASGNLQFTLTPNTFTCDDVGTNIVTLHVTDQAGNTDYCETYVIIQDNMVVCPDILTADVSGTVANAAGSGVQNVLIDVSGNGPLTTPAMTAQNGHFQFFDLDLGYDYTFTPSLNQQPLNGVTTYDLVLMTRHILGIQPLDSPFNIIAADVNKSSTVTTADVVELRKLILQIIPTFTNNTSWRFVDKKYSFQNPQNPFQPPFPEFTNINDLDDNYMDIDFVAVKTGDVNGSAVTHNLGGDQNDDRSQTGSLTFIIDDQPVEEGGILRVPFKADNFINLLGYQFALRFDPNMLELVDIETGDLPNLSDGNFGLAMLNEGIITTSWDNSKNTLQDDNTILFTLVFRSNQRNNAQGYLSDLLQIVSNPIAAEAYQSAGENSMNLMSVQLGFTNKSTTGTGFELYQNNPNPFREQTVIGFNLPGANTATLTVYDLSGKVMSVVTGSFAKGYNEIELNSKELGTSGVLFYQLETPEHTATRRMVRL